MKKYLRLSLLTFSCAVAFAPLVASAGPLATFGTKGEVGPGNKVLVNEFVITGTQPKKIVVRGIGAGLGSVTSLPDATLEIRNANGEILEGLQNDNWKTRKDGTSQQAEIQATGLAPIHDLDAAIIANLNPGTYTAIMGGKGNASGGGVCDFFDIQQASSSVPAYGSRVDLDQNADTPTAFSGFQLTEQRSVVVRVLGPSLGQGSNAISGTVADPFLEITDQNGSLVSGGQSDNWKTQGGSGGTGLEPSNDAESAVLLQNLPPGSYTARVYGKNADGIVFVQVYALPYNTPLDPAPSTAQGSQPPTATAPVAWFRAHDLTIGAVSSWQDASGNGNNATQPSPARQPSLIQNSPINGQPAVRFDGQDDQLAFNRVVQDDFTIAVVFYSAGGVSNGSQWYHGSGMVDAEVANITNDFGISYTADGRVLAGVGNPDVTASSAAGLNSKAHQAVFRRKESTGVTQLYIDGALVSSKVGGTQTLNAPSRITLGML